MSLPSPSRPFKRLMLLLLWAPAAWIAYFWVVYLAAEVACVDQPIGSRIGETGLAVFVVVSSVVALPAVGAVWMWARRSGVGETSDQGLRLIVVLLVGCFMLAVVAVGLPALVLDPC